MKSRNSGTLSTLALLVLLAIPILLAAQEQPNTQKKARHRYKLIDLGTFGGPESNVNNAVNAGPIVSRRGAAVGASATSVPVSSHSHTPSCAEASTASSHSSSTGFDGWTVS